MTEKAAGPDPRWCDYKGYLDGQIGYIEKAVAESYVLSGTSGGFTKDIKGVPVYANLSEKHSLVMSKIEDLISESYLALNEIDKRKEFMEGYIDYLWGSKFKLMKQELSPRQDSSL